VCTISDTRDSGWRGGARNRFAREKDRIHPFSRPSHRKRIGRSTLTTEGLITTAGTEREAEGSRSPPLSESASGGMRALPWSIRSRPRLRHHDRAGFLPPLPSLADPPRSLERLTFPAQSSQTSPAARGPKVVSYRSGGRRTGEDLPAYYSLSMPRAFEKTNLLPPAVANGLPH